MKVKYRSKAQREVVEWILSNEDAFRVLILSINGNSKDKAAKILYQKFQKLGLTETDKGTKVSLTACRTAMTALT